MNTCDVQQGNLEASKRNFLRASLGSTEILCLTVALIVNVFFWFVLKETRMLLHVSRMLIFNAIFAEIMTIVARYFIAINVMFEEQLIDKPTLWFFAFFHDSAQMMMNLNEGMIVIVCWLTITWNAQMSNGSLAFLSCFVVCVPWLVASSILTMEWLQIIPSNPIQLFYCILNVTCFLALLHLSSLGRTNYKRQDVGNLLGKFRASMQIRTLKVMLAIAFLSVIRTTVTNAVLILIKYYLFPNCMIVEARNVSFSIDLTIALHALLQPLFMIRTNQEMAKNCRQLAHRLLHCHFKVPSFDIKIAPQPIQDASLTPHPNDTVDSDQEQTLTFDQKQFPGPDQNHSSTSEQRPSSPQINNFLSSSAPKTLSPSDQNPQPSQSRNSSFSQTKKLSVVGLISVEQPRNALGQLLLTENSQEEHFKQLLKAWS